MLNTQMHNINRLVGEHVVEAPLFSWNPRVPCLHRLLLSSLTVRHAENICSEANSGGASHQAKQPSAMSIGCGSQQATNALLVVFMDGTKAKVMFDGMERLDDSGTPSGQLVEFQDMVSSRMGNGQAFDRKE